MVLAEPSEERSCLRVKYLRNGVSFLEAGLRTSNLSGRTEEKQGNHLLYVHKGRQC